MKKQKFTFTLIELLVVISIMLILISLLFPSLRLSKIKAKQIKCAGNIKQLSVALSSYSIDFSDYTPPAYTGSSAIEYLNWCYILKYAGYFDCWKFFGTGTGYSLSQPHSGDFCPEKDLVAQWSRYGMNRFILADGASLKISRISMPSETILIGENGNNSTVDGLWHTYPNDMAVHPRHMGGANYLFYDMHVSWSRANPADTTKFKWTLP